MYISITSDDCQIIMFPLKLLKMLDGEAKRVI